MVGQRLIDRVAIDISLIALRSVILVEKLRIVSSPWEGSCYRLHLL